MARFTEYLVLATIYHTFLHTTPCCSGNHDDTPPAASLSRALHALLYMLHIAKCFHHALAMVPAKTDECAHYKMFQWSSVSLQRKGLFCWSAGKIFRCRGKLF